MLYKKDGNNTMNDITQDTTTSEEKAVVKAKPKKLAKPKGTKSFTGDLEVNTITGKVSIKNPDGSETLTEIPIKEVIVAKPMVNVGMSAAHTHNLGNYSSAKISVSLFVPCAAEELEETYGFIKGWVNEKMVEVIAEITGNN